MVPSTFLSLKSVVLFSTTVLSAAIALRYCFSTADLIEVASAFHDGVVSWLRPPYLYLLINVIIITIAASSKFGSTTTASDNKDESDVAPSPLQPREICVSLSPVTSDISTEGLGRTVFNAPPSEFKHDGAISAELEENETAAFRARDAIGDKENGFFHKVNVVDRKSSPTKLNKEYSTVPGDEKPPARARFGHRRNGRASPEGVKTVLGVSKPKRQDTLESTWKTITEGRPIPLTRHLKKSDTWERHGQQDKTPPKKKTAAAMSKSETFNDRANRSYNQSPGSGGGSGKIRGEPSLSKDELNRRIEAFIKKFNEEMRLQRQESMNQYMDMINRGSN